MKRYKCAGILALFLFGIVAVSEAQFKEDISGPGDYTGAVIKTNQSQTSPLGNLMESINMTMSHSYSMNFGSFGGSFQNLNAYTNHMSFDLSKNLTGHMDVSVLHSPFGNSFMNSGNSPGTGIVIDRAQLDYRLSPNSSLSIQFSQRPGHYGMGYYPGSFGPGNNIWY